MIVENSGKIFLFKLEHDLGYGYAEVYDFTDHSKFDGRYVFVYNRIDKIPQTSYTLAQISSSGIALGPITLFKFPNTRGVGAWKFLFQTDTFLMEDLPITKDLKGLMFKDDNWDNHENWFKSGWDLQKLPEYVNYEKVRSLETRMLNSNISVVKKFAMKTLIDGGKKVSDFYDLEDLGTRNIFVQLINTYYQLDKTKLLLKQISNKNGR